MGCIGGGMWPGDRCIFQISFSGVIQVLLSSSQALNSANYYQLGILKKQPEKHFTLLQLALAHQPVLCRVKSSCQAVMCFVFFPLPDYSWAEAELITSETVFFGLAADQECHFTKKCWGFRNKVSLQCGMKLGSFKHCQGTVNALNSSCPSLHSPPFPWIAEYQSALRKTWVQLAPFLLTFKTFLSRNSLDCGA